MIYSENILICIASPIVVMMLFIPAKNRHLLSGILLGMMGSLLGAYMNSYFGGIFEMDVTMTSRYIAPLVEESMKLLPILLYLLLFDPEEQSLIGFAIAVGTGFATFENCCYITQNGSELIRFVLVRGLAVGIMHVVCGLCIGVSLVLVKRYKSIMIPATIGALSFAMTIHALYNLLVSVEGITSIIGFYTPIGCLVAFYLVWTSRKGSKE